MNLRNLKFQKLTMQQAQKIQGGCLAGEVLLNMAKWDKEIKEKRALDSLIRR